MKSTIKHSLSLLALSSLTACGGGGSNTGSSTKPAVQPPIMVITPTVTPADIQQAVPSLSYADSSQEFAFVTAYNNFRSAMGLGLLTQSAPLDKAARNHLSYVMSNSSINGGTVDMSSINPIYNIPNFHIEDPSKASFTGIRVADRVNFTGYVNTAAIEEGSYGAGAGATAAVKTLLATIYHRQGFMNQGIRDIGVAVGADLAQTTIINLGFGVKSQSNSSDYVGVYPADKQTLVPLFASPEAPNPYTEISDVLNDTHRRTTYPVSIAIKEGLSLAIESFTITEAGHTQAIKARIFTSANDKAISSSNAFVVGYEPFKSNTTYMVSFKGTANGTAISKNWTFTTAASCLNVFTCN
ncbi:CAP domain-containing protein [Pseudoduganella danionis]|uniref:SCP domain-containing protein n=1 Tax=Pseudoduganella danionis TaxID=1890295 RepID=A0ABW9SU74_9BURK|nr:CAP domain-containing protein [Pseudoduganella danionis]MTW35415.1 hypothetical protein [Pseudoduganella danionis]